MYEFRLGRSIAQVVPFVRYRKPIDNQPIITNKILVIFAVVAIIKISILIVTL